MPHEKAQAHHRPEPRTLHEGGAGVQPGRQAEDEVGEKHSQAVGQGPNPPHLGGVQQPGEGAVERLPDLPGRPGEEQALGGQGDRDHQQRHLGRPLEEKEAPLEKTQ